MITYLSNITYVEWCDKNSYNESTGEYNRRGYFWQQENFGDFLGTSGDDVFGKSTLNEFKFRKDTGDSSFSFVLEHGFSLGYNGTAYLYKTNVVNSIVLGETKYSYTMPSVLGVYSASASINGSTGECTFSNIDVSGMPDEFSLYVFVTTNYGGLWFHSAATQITMPASVRIQPQSGTLLYTGSNAEIVCTTNGNALSLSLSVNSSGASPFWTGTVPATVDMRTLTVNIPESIYDTASATTTSVTIYLYDSKLGKMQEISVYPGGALSPTISSASAQMVQSSKSAWATQYIAGYTSQRIEVNASAISTKKNATVSTVEAIIQNRSYTMTLSGGVYSCTSNVLSAIGYESKSTVTVTDSRGAKATYEVTLPRVYEYSPPVVVVQEAYRCDSRGVKGNDINNFSYYRARAKATITVLTGNSIQSMVCQISGDSKQNSLTNDVISSPTLLSTGAMNYKLAYTLNITVTDRMTSTTIQVGLAGLKRDFIVSRKNGASKVGVGTTPQDSSTESTIEMASGGQLIIGTGSIHAIFSDQKIVLVEGKTFGTTTQRNSLSPVKGQLYFNTTTAKLQIYNGSSWIG